MTTIGPRSAELSGQRQLDAADPGDLRRRQDGRIKARFVDPDYRKRMAIEELIDALK